jgi:hypothetical protein
MKNKFNIIRIIASILIIIGLANCRQWNCFPDKQDLILLDANGREIRELPLGDSLAVGLNNFKPGSSARVVLRESQSGEQISYFQLTADKKGEIAPSILWYNSGVVDERTAKSRKLRPYQFASFEEASARLSGKKLSVTVETADGKKIMTRELPVIDLEKRNTHLIYFSNDKGELRNSFVLRKDQAAYLTIKKAGDIKNASIFLVPNRYQWTEGMPIQEVRREYQAKLHVVKIEDNKKSQIVKISDMKEKLLGAYDIIIRTDIKDQKRVLSANDIVFHTLDTGILFQLVYDPPWTNYDFDIAGKPVKKYGYPYFEFHDVFRTGEAMWGAVDPAIVPSPHAGGDYATYYVINHGSAAGGLVDQTGALETVPVKSGCINVSMIKIWDNPVKGEYDVVVDFGSTVAMSQGAWVADNTFNPGLDFIDRSTVQGAYVVSDPALGGSYTPVAYSYEPATAIPSDPLRTDISNYFNTPSASVTETMNAAPLRGTGYYPSQAGQYPLVLIVHGNHTPTHASHTGYDYLCRLLATHGIIAFSIDENFLNGGVSGEMGARAIILLRHLQKFREWDTTPGHVLNNKIDLNKIGLSGHSRGGEAITVAKILNTALHNAADPLHNFNFSIVSLYAIAPVDGQINNDDMDLATPGTQNYPQLPVQLQNVDYFIMHGSHDGDVHSFDGQRTYDRAFPPGSPVGGWKGLLFVYGANHNYWNQEWVHANDGSRINSSLTQIAQIPQQDIAKVYMSAFFQLTLKSVKPYVALFTGDVEFGSLPAGVTRIHQYNDKDHVDLANYQEDNNAATGSYAGVTIVNPPVGMALFSDSTITPDDWCDSSNNTYYLWNQTNAVIAGWINNSAKYEINIPAGIGPLVNANPYLSFRIGQIYESPASYNTPGAEQDLNIRLNLGMIQTYSWFNISNFDNLPYPVETIENYYCPGTNITKSVMKTVRIPLRSFITNHADWNLTDINKITLEVTPSPNQKGLVVIDDIQITK